jgi:hypothetical protein
LHTAETRINPWPGPPSLCVRRTRGPLDTRRKDRVACQPAHNLRFQPGHGISGAVRQRRRVKVVLLSHFTTTAASRRVKLCWSAVARPVDRRDRPCGRRAVGRGGAPDVWCILSAGRQPRRMSIDSYGARDALLKGPAASTPRVGLSRYSSSAATSPPPRPRFGMRISLYCLNRRRATGSPSLRTLSGSLT